MIEVFSPLFLFLELIFCCPSKGTGTDIESQPEATKGISTGASNPHLPGPVPSPPDMPLVNIQGVS